MYVSRDCKPKHYEIRLPRLINSTLQYMPHFKKQPCYALCFDQDIMRLFGSTAVGIVVNAFAMQRNNANQLRKCQIQSVSSDSKANPLLLRRTWLLQGICW
jgi:hypothetical protein